MSSGLSNYYCYVLLLLIFLRFIPIYKRKEKIHMVIIYIVVIGSMCICTREIEEIAIFLSI